LTQILRVAAINGAAYEWIHHEQVGRDAGLTLAQLKRIRDIDTPLDNNNETNFSPLQRALLALADSLTRDCIVPDQTWAALRQELEADQARQSRGITVEQQLMEASVTASAYNMVSRFLRATDVTGAKDDKVPQPE
jgi:alkylhydroperoxidase family enzyme